MVACYCRKLFQVKTITQNAGGMRMLIAVTLSRLENHDTFLFFYGLAERASSSEFDLQW